MTEIAVKGLAELRQTLLKFPAKIQRRALDKAMAAGARVVVAAAKRNAPVDTGAIKRNIVAKKGPKRYQAGADSRYIVGVRHGKTNTNATTAGGRTRKVSAYDKRGEDPYYWRFQELGFTAVGRRAKRIRVVARDRRGRFRYLGNAANTRAKGRKIPGTKFLTRAFESVSAAATEKIRSVLAQEIAKLT